MSTVNQQFADQYIHHSTEPLGLRQAQAVDAANAQNVEPEATMPAENTMTDAARYAPEPAADLGEKPMDAAPMGAAPANLSPEAEGAFHDIIYPSDSYTSNGTYWADLPLHERLSFVNSQSNAEARRELGVMWSMFKSDPLSLVKAYFSRYVINGLGMFVEGYTLFSVGNLKPLFQNTDHSVAPEKGDHSSAFYRCWKTNEICNKDWMRAIDYLEIVGIICGQILVGVEGDWVGRKFGMVQDALIMTLGSVMLTCMWGITMNGWVICYAWSLFIYGLGVGGEYPMTSTRSMEVQSSRYATSADDRLHRGRNVLLAFLMQGWGQFFNQVILILLVLIFNNTLKTPIKPAATQYSFRISFGFIAAVTLYLAYYRYYQLSYHSDEALRDAKDRLNTSGYDAKSLKLAMTHYWHRLIATTVGWFCNDFFFYGNKIFSGVFIKLITGANSTFSTGWLYNLINVGVQLPGYYMAALLVDHKFYGRKWMQTISFAATFALFCGAAFSYDTLISSQGNLKAFQFIFFFSSFWNQFGYNSTTFLVAAEVFPASIRATCHGIGAAWGKLGALAPTIIYNYVDSNKTKFYIVTWFGLAGLIVTLLFLPDTTGLDLREQERYWEYVMAGNGQDYHGVAVHPRHLSLFERFVLKRHLPYNPQLDAQQKTEEFRQVYQSSVGLVGANEHDLTVEQRDFLSSEFASKFVKGGDAAKPSNQVFSSKLESLEKQL
ncbi:hypothetical protein MEQU1_001414 [Malassezia equina]|uniref:Major facilitator superfamily (MFS) profile domain-containing protein n=1 Tax=Malassezia equina TaxID=1381935 RepID=A0AAF0EBZ5_9BASI|nr:hypothetical protein MEQU1_001414 [Malassezia equina]